MVEFKKSNRKNKKYMVNINNKWIHFGDIRYQHYKDSTPLKLYTHLDHNDPARRKRYRQRHEAIKTREGQPAYKDKNKASYWAYNYLW